MGAEPAQPRAAAAVVASTATLPSWPARPLPFPPTYEQQQPFISYVRTGTRQPKVEDDTIYSFVIYRFSSAIYSFYVRFE
jgi:hypothetical protein